MENQSQYKSSSEWAIACPSEYNSAKRQGLLGDICKHFGWRYFARRPNGYWTKERCIEDVRKYSSPLEWREKSKGAFNAAKRCGFFDECIRESPGYQDYIDYRQRNKKMH